MRTPVIYLLLFLLPTSLCFAQKDSCKLGIYINSLYDFKLEEKNFIADFWLWQTYKNDSLNFENAVEITNSKSAEFSHFSHEKKSNINWISQKCKAQVRQEWDVSRFPFDNQVLRIEIEDSKYNSLQLVYVVDRENSRIDSCFNSKEWCIERFSVNADEHIYETTYGDPELSGQSAYPRIVAEIEISRTNSWRILIKMLTGAYVAFLISCLVFFISSNNQDSRFGLCVGGLFTAIGNKYIVESIVPSSSASSLMDNVHSITFAFILLIVCITIVSLRLFESADNRKKQLSLKLDKWSFFSVIILYILINTVVICSALK
jgi:hypothetical protein